MTKKITKKELEQRLLVSEEMRKHYEELYKTAFQEHQHQGEQKMSFDNLICDVHELLKK